MSETFGFDISSTYNGELIGGCQLDGGFCTSGNGFFNEFNANHRSIIAVAISQFDDARIATGTVGIALCDIVEQFIEDGVRCFQFGDEFCTDQIAIDGT